MSSVANNWYEDVFVFEDLVYAIECQLCVVHVYRNHKNSLIKLHDVRYPCGCSNRYPHSIIVTNEHIIQCCDRDKLVSILDRSGELLRKIPIAYILIYVHEPILRQVDVQGNFLISDCASNLLAVGNAYQPTSEWGVVDFADSPGSDSCRGAVWFRHRLYVASRHGHLLTFAPLD